MCTPHAHILIATSPSTLAYLFFPSLLPQYRKDGSAFEVTVTVMPVFDWLVADTTTTDSNVNNSNNNINNSNINNFNNGVSGSATASAALVTTSPSPVWTARSAAITMDYGGGASRATRHEKDRMAMHPSHFVAKLEVVSRAAATGANAGDDEDEDEDAETEFPPLTPQEIFIRDFADRRLHLHSESSSSSSATAAAASSVPNTEEPPPQLMAGAANM